MKRILTLALAVISVACLQLLHAQSKVNFGYDSAGNRVSRTIPPLLKSAAASETTRVYSEQLSDIQINIYPNPTNGVLKVEILHLPDHQTAEIRLYNLSGHLIISRKTTDDATTIDISRKPAGIYVMTIKAGEYHTEWKIIKK